MIVALCGNQNAGKTTLFNLLTGAAEHVGNYPGVTVEQRVGRLLPTYQQGANAVQIVDLPGVYSLTPYSREEAVTREYILREKPDIVIQVLDVTSLQRGLYLTLELMALGRPLVLALNMTEALAKSGGMLDVQRLQARLGVPCISHQRPHRARRAAVDGRGHAGGAKAGQSARFARAVSLGIAARDGAPQAGTGTVCLDRPLPGRLPDPAPQFPAPAADGLAVFKSSACLAHPGRAGVGRTVHCLWAARSNANTPF